MYFRYKNLLLASFLLSVLVPQFATAQSSNLLSEVQASQTLLGTGNLLGGATETSDALNFSNALQNIRTSALSDYLEITTTPNNPKPNEETTITVESNLTDLDKAEITWTRNGRTVTKGVGERSFTFTNGASGILTTINVSIVTNAKETFSKQLSFRPMGVTVLWEADTYTPPFYKGKPLLSAQATVRAIAIPDTVDAKSFLTPQNFSYVWKRGGTVDQTASGYGKNSFSFRAPRPNESANVQVSISSLDDSVSSSQKILIPVISPFILLYENHPLLGIWHNRPFGSTLNLTKQEISLIAEPYFFSNEEREGGSGAFRYIWSLNGKNLENGGREVTLRNESGTKGSSKISMNIQGLDYTFQSGTRGLTINFAENGLSGQAF